MNVNCVKCVRVHAGFIKLEKPATPRVQTLKKKISPKGIRSMPFFSYDGFNFPCFATESELVSALLPIDCGNDEIGFPPLLVFRNNQYNHIIDAYNDGYRNAWALGYYHSEPSVITCYVHGYVLRYRGISESEFFTFLHWWNSQPLTASPNSPNPPSPQDELTMTDFYYGTFTFTTMTASTCKDSERISEEEAIKELTMIYNQYFSPNPLASKSKKKHVYVKDFISNCWIEKNSNGMVHLHCFYKRKKGFFHSGKGTWKNNSIMKNFIRIKNCRTDNHIRNCYKYCYEDCTSKVLHKFPFEIESLS